MVQVCWRWEKISTIAVARVSLVFSCVSLLEGIDLVQVVAKEIVASGSGQDSAEHEIIAPHVSHI